MCSEWFDLHRHDEYSSFDGFGKATELSKQARELGMDALGISNHGNTNGLVQHYMACMANGIKPILGVEGYFIPKYKEKHRGYHLCLFAKNHTGYRNINTIQFEGEKQKYYNPIWTFDLLEKYHEGIICTSACVAGFLPQCIINGKLDVAKKFIRKMVNIFGKDFYLEVQPYKISEPGLQERINKEIIKLGNELKVKCILTSDSHRGRKEDMPTYLKMHQIPGHDLEHITSTYKDRYMPSQKEIVKRFINMHKDDFPGVEAIADKMVNNQKKLKDSVEPDIFKDLQQTLPDMQSEYGSVRDLVMEGLKKRGKYNKKYIKRVNEELEVIEELGFDDYFLMVQDYVNWAKAQGITVGPGRGSCCNSEVAYALGITEVDSIYYGLDFRRFLRKDKKKMPDIDLDFEKSRRQEVINYIINKYEGHTARIASYGLYKVDNLVNDLAKVCGLDTKVTNENRAFAKKEIANIKAHISNYVDENLNLDVESFLMSNTTKKYNALYDDICIHFSKLYKKMRFIGTHAAGVAVTGGNILDYTSLRISKDGDYYTNYDLNDMENIKVIKFDILGLVTMEEIGALRKATGCNKTYEEMVEDEVIMEAFHQQNTTGIFQFDKPAVKNLLSEIDCSCFDDIVAANAINRPGPLGQGAHKQYAYNKQNIEESKLSPYYKYTKETYGTVVYQEQIQQVCVNIAGMSWGDADKVMKMIGGQSQSEDARIQFEKDKKELGTKFVQGAVKNGLTKQQAKEMFRSMLVYSFNKGHAVGYSLISVEEMNYKMHYPMEFWWAKLKYCPNDKNIFQLERDAVKDGCVILTPHVNGSMRYSIKNIKGEKCIMQGLSDVKGIGEKVAQAIYHERKANGPYTSIWDMEERLPKRILNTRVIEILKACGAVQFNQKAYYDNVFKYNVKLSSK